VRVMSCQKSRMDIVKRVGSHKSMDRIVAQTVHEYDVCPNVLYISVPIQPHESTDGMALIGESIDKVEPT